MDDIQQKFLQLTQISLGFRTRFDVAPDEAQWWAILAEAEKQKLKSFLFTGVDRLEDDQVAPFKPRSRFTAEAFRIAGKNAAMDHCAAEVSRMLSEQGRASCVLKGQGAAMLYEHPERRQCGDIDIWVEGDTPQTIALLKAHWPVGNVVYHHADVKMIEGAEVEVHFHPTWMNDPFADRRLQRWFEDRAGKGFCNFREEKGFRVPDTTFNLVFSLVHIFRHIFYEGIGMRQLVDYCHILMHSTPEERREAYEFLKSIHLQRFCAALMWVMRDCLGMGMAGSEGVFCGGAGADLADGVSGGAGGSGLAGSAGGSELVGSAGGSELVGSAGGSELVGSAGGFELAGSAGGSCGGAKDGMLLCEPDEKAGRILIESVFQGGNFGRHDERNTHKAGEGLISRIIRIARLRSRFALTYPREILWSPYFKTWQYLWRRRRGYMK